jgi:hypothetical protein
MQTHFAGVAQTQFAAIVPQTTPVGAETQKREKQSFRPNEPKKRKRF